jgi:hypothetical protein
MFLLMLLYFTDICSGYCQNMGECSARKERATCFCKPGYTGIQCESGIIFLQMFFYRADIFFKKKFVNTRGNYIGQRNLPLRIKYVMCD